MSAPVHLASASSASVAPIFKKIGLIRLTIVSAVLLSVAIVAGTGLFLSNLRDHTYAENERVLSNTALILAKQFTNVFAAVENVQSRIIDETAAFKITDSSDRERELSTHDFHLALRKYAAGGQFLGGLTFINAQGRVINISQQWPIPDISAADRDFFKAFQADPDLMSFIGEPIQNRASGTWVIQFARKISGPNREFWGLITAAVELEALQNMFSEIVLESGGQLALFRNDGVLLAGSPITDSNFGRRFPTAPALNLVSAANRGIGVGVRSIDGKISMIAAYRVGSYPIVVAARETIESVLAGWRQMAAYVSGISFLSIVTIAAFTLLFIKQFKYYQALIEARAAQEKAEQLRELSLRFHVAANNMSQGLLMFDAAARLVVCNERYIEMYRLSPEVVRPGLTLLDLTKHRAEAGMFNGDPDEYCSKILEQIAQGRMTSELM